MDWELIARCINSVIDNFFAKRTQHMKDVSVQAIDNIDLVVDKVCNNMPKYASSFKNAVENMDQVFETPAEVQDEELPN
tara:strand:+ start:174 stop:410 length:237 start_codon:yes stop_codon:yes gene_type:complete